MQKLYVTIENEINERLLSKPTRMSCHFNERTDGIKKSHMTGINQKNLEQWSEFNRYFGNLHTVLLI